MMMLHLGGVPAPVRGEHQVAVEGFEVGVGEQSLLGGPACTLEVTVIEVELGQAVCGVADLLLERMCEVRRPGVLAAGVAQDTPSHERHRLPQRGWIIRSAQRAEAVVVEPYGGRQAVTTLTSVG
jgi:hypothetical protein